MLRKLVISAIILIGLSLHGILAQEANMVSGGNATGSGGSVSYSVGQVGYTTHTSTNGSVVQGVQQPFEIALSTSTEEVIGISLNYKVYPNPAKSFLTLSLENIVIENLSYQLYNINGKLLSNNQLIDPVTDISMENFNPGVYFLKVIESNKEIKTFKIIKN